MKIINTGILINTGIFFINISMIFLKTNKYMHDTSPQSKAISSDT